MSEQILEFVRRRLNESRGDWPKIAVATGVPYGTVTNIAQGKSKDPQVSSLQPLLNYFHELDAMLERVKQGGAHDAKAA